MLDTMSHPLPLRAKDQYWTTSWYDDDGHRRTRRFGNIHTTPRKTAEAAYQRFLVQWHTDEGVRCPGRQAASVDDLCDLYEAWAEKHYRRKDGSPTGEHSNVKDALRDLRVLFGGEPADTIGIAALKVYRAKLASDDFARTTINQRVVKIRTMYRWAADAELMPAHVWGELMALKPLRRGERAGNVRPKESEGVKPAPEHDILKAKACMPLAVAGMVDLQLLTAMRPTEACLMRGCDIDTTGDIWLYRPRRHKTEHFGHDRIIYLGPKAQATIKRYLTVDLQAHLFDPRQSATRPSHMIRDHYDSRSYRQAVVRACRRAGVPEWSPNQLRHNAATRIRKEHGPEVAQVVLGHMKIDTTERYAERDEAAAIRAIRKSG